MPAKKPSVDRGLDGVSPVEGFFTRDLRPLIPLRHQSISRHVQQIQQAVQPPCKLHDIESQKRIRDGVPTFGRTKHRSGKLGGNCANGIGFVAQDSPRSSPGSSLRG